MKFILYCLCGGIGVASDYLIYCIALQLDIWYQVSNILGYLSGTVVSFLLNRKITFGVNDQFVRRFVMFLGVALVGFSVSAVLLWVLVDYLFIEPKFAKILTLPAVVVIQFALNRRITFAKNSSNN